MTDIVDRLEAIASLGIGDPEPSMEDICQVCRDAITEIENLRRIDERLVDLKAIIEEQAKIVASLGKSG